MPNFYIKTLGCKVNQYDSSFLKKELENLGFLYSETDADLIIINTCAVTNTAIAKSKKLIFKLKKNCPNVKIGVLGCWPKIYQKIKKELMVDLVCPAGEYNKFLKNIKEKFDFENYIKKIKISEKQKSRYAIKIQDGCEQFCTYCIIPYTRGKIKSRQEKEIIAEIELAVFKGYQEIVLCGIHLGMYGKDLGRNYNLENLIKKIIKIKNLSRIRLSSIELNEVSDGIIELIKNSNKICRHLHIPLQSGSDQILKSMNRPYTTSEYQKKIKNIRKYMPEIAITTDVIVGFPGENTELFKQTYEFVKKIKFSRLHVFPYSKHLNTPAAKYSGQVYKHIKIERAKKIRSLGYRLTKDYIKQFKNKELSLIVEKQQKEFYVGKSEFYFDVKFKLDQIINQNKSGNENRIIIGKLVKVNYR